MSKPVVVVTRRWPNAVEERLMDVFDARLNDDDHPFSPQELVDAIKTADALMPTVTDKISADIIGTAGRKARIIGNFGVGFNNIDIDAAKKHGVVVTNTPEVLTDCTADIAMILLLSVARRIGEGERHLRGGQWTGWRPTHMMGQKVSGKTLGLIGYGRIAQAMARRALGFGMTLIYYDPYVDAAKLDKSVPATAVSSIDEVLAQADFVSLHCPSTPETRHLINSESFAKMKPTAFLINTARGDIVDESALIAALREDVIQGAGLDVYEKEPKVPADLLKMNNVVLLPHLGSASTQTREAMGMRVLTNVEAFFAGKTPPDRVV
ncbi:MAG: D-glycerate dehydrogenase [Alphaproteobacteria bacterium GM202ARS2]|nr:D-glycerate dehydrogenase [Alphaproteobacteria bacterium GM202ARS2]